MGLDGKKQRTLLDSKNTRYQLGEILLFHAMQASREQQFHTMTFGCQANVWKGGGSSERLQMFLFAAVYAFIFLEIIELTH